MDTKSKGSVTELRCIASFIECGYSVSIPYGENCKYDFVVDINGRFIRVQTKTCRSADDGSTISFSCESTRVNCHNITYATYTSSDIDYFATYWDNRCYIVPVSECNVHKTLRFVPPGNNQRSKIYYAADYELSHVLSTRFNQFNNQKVIGSTPIGSS